MGAADRGTSRADEGAGRNRGGCGRGGSRRAPARYGGPGGRRKGRGGQCLSATASSFPQSAGLGAATKGSGQSAGERNRAQDDAPRAPIGSRRGRRSVKRIGSDRG